MTDQSGPASGDRIRESWVANAGAWTASVREGRIPSRRLGTDAAIVAACLRVLRDPASARVLDVGCGEGWLSRALAAYGAHVVGVDGSEPLVVAARNAAAGAATASQYVVMRYEDLAEDPAILPGPFDLIVCNYALFVEDLVPTLGAFRARLAPRGALVIQTVHPWSSPEHAYADGWREESFAAFEQRFPASMPWFSRTMSGWIAVLADARLTVATLAEPLHPETGQPMSLILTARAHDGMHA